MAKTVKILVACGSGIATSMLVACVVREYMEQQKLSVSIDGTSVNNIPFRLTGNDIIISSAQVPFNTGLPVFNALPILTNRGREELLEAIAAKVRELSEKG